MPDASRADLEAGLYSLPSLLPAADLVFQWGEHDSISFVQMISEAYAEVVHCRKNVFSVTFGKVGKLLRLS